MLLRLIPGLQLEVLDSQCCGIAGTYGFKTENYAVSQAIGAPLFRQIEESGAVVVGKGKPGFPGGTEIPPTKVDVVRPN